MAAEALKRAAQAIDRAEMVVVTTGAGMSRESGIPTFRDVHEGLWARYDPEELATRHGFRDDPARVWGWYNYRRGLIARAQPHDGHHALVRLERWVQLGIRTPRKHSSLQVLRAGSSRQSGHTDLRERCSRRTSTLSRVRVAGPSSCGLVR